ncbi:hypothetical protein CROQUDRAFT_674001 [Cronartium quercuum f. sp. fusiforme G11]|uniref:Uncharacterized protein n=1 Tax=Cronartium quercuum f. sp. fusiforme G11 TaxID=708437 RepID=A0A9P6N8L1_9BASI|nr:hypothetical protein CROQUDRAFT_674001 [Cronartium quercuum f. sp. fusiforme G11]
MPGGRPFVLVLQKVFWGTAIFQIFFVGALLGAITQGNTHRHPVLLAFLITTWFSSWVSLMPLFGGFWEFAKPVPLTRSNLPPGTIPFKLCQVNAILTSYIWATIPGFAFAFSGEALRILLGLSTQRMSSTSTLVGDNPMWSGDQIQRAKKPASRFNFLLRFIIVPDRSIWCEHFLVVIPLVSALPGPFITGRALFRQGWKTVHADEFVCGALGENTQTGVSQVMLWHFVPAFLVGLAAIGTYLLFRRSTRAIIRSQIHMRLLLRLAALSLLSGLGALGYLILRVGPTGNRTRLSRQYGWVLPMYMICFPLVGSTFFVDFEIIQIWRSWFKFGPREASFDMEKWRSNFQKSASLPSRPCKSVSGKIASYDLDLYSYDQRAPSYQQPPPLPRPSLPRPPPPHLGLLDMMYGLPVYISEPQKFV